MLSSSDAKWKCMWYLFVWSIELTLVSNFLNISDHIAFYIFAAVSVLILPVLTAIYSNTSGRHGAGLLRFGLVFCDPVLSSLTVTPVLLLNKIPLVIEENKCFREHVLWNETYSCMLNTTDMIFIQQFPLDTPSLQAKQDFIIANKKMFQVIQLSIVVPILLVLLMGRRTRKMNFNTFVLGFTYWFIASLESADLLDIIFLVGERYEYTIFTIEAIACIVMIVTNSYAVVTLCSYVSPMGLVDTKRSKNKFDFLYRIFSAISGALFVEIPFLVVRCQIIVADKRKILPGPFYIWLIKDILWLLLIGMLIYVQKFGQKYLRVPLKPRYANKRLYFQPEKRDAYIKRYRRESSTESCDSVSVLEKTPVSNVLQKSSSVPNLQSTEQVNHLHRSASRSTSDLNKMDQSITHDKASIIRSLKNFSFIKSGFRHKSTDGVNKSKKKKVTFKVDLGKGKFLEMKARSDSPPVFHIENEENYNQ